MSSASTLAYANPTKNARRYPDPKGDRVNVSWIIANKGITADAWRGLLARLGGKAPRAYPERLPGYGRTEDTWREADVDATLANRPAFPIKVREGAWTDEKTFQHRNGKLCLTVQGAIRAGHSRKVGERYTSAPCRFLRNKQGQRRAIEHYHVTPPFPRNCGECGVLVLVKQDLDAIARAIGAAPPAEIVKERGVGRRVPATVLFSDALGDWHTDTQARKLFDVEPNMLTYWSKRDSIRRKGQKALRTKKAPNPFPGQGGPGETTVYLGADVADILEGKETIAPGTGTGDNANRLRAEQDAKAKQALLSIFAGGRALPSSEVLAKAKADFRVGPRYIRRAFKLYGKRTRDGLGQTYLWQLNATARRTGGSQGTTPTVQQGASRPTAGRGRDPEMSKLKRFCYEKRKAGKVWRAVALLARAQPEFSDYELTDATAAIYARRHAKDNDLPWPIC